MAQGFSSLTPNLPRNPTPMGIGPQGTGSDLVDTAATKARNAMNTLGVPSFADIFKQFGSGFGTTEFGNSGVAGEGAAYERGNLDSERAALNAREAQGLGKAGSNPFAADAGADAREYTDPTHSSAFRAAMNLASEKTAAAVDEEQRMGADAAMKRGFAGGYDPRRAGLDRMEALSEAGFAGVSDIRNQALDKYKTDQGAASDAARADLEARTSRYNTDIGSLTSKYGADTNAYASLLNTQAELPTKMLSALSPLYGSLFGGASDFYKTALSGLQGEDALRRQQQQEQHLKLYGIGPEFAPTGRNVITG